VSYLVEFEQVDSEHLKKRSVPRVTVTGQVRRKRVPTKVSVRVTVEAEARHREGAIDGLARGLEQIQTICKELGDAVLEQNIGSPSECKREEEKTLRTIEVVKFSVFADIVLGDCDRLGELIVGLLRHELKFDQPQFSQDEAVAFGPADYKEASEQAREIAENLARGSGAKLGSVLKMEVPGFGLARYNVPLGTWWRRRHPLSSFQYDLNNFSFVRSKPHVWETLESTLATDVPEVTDILSVNVTYELVS
jgi:hypothetical protein